MKIDSYQVGMDSARTYSSSSTRKLALSYARQDFQGSLGSMQESLEGSQYSLEDSNEQNTATGDNMSLDDIVSSMQSPFSRISQVDHTNTLRSIDDIRQKFVLYLWQMFFGRDRARSMAEEMGMPCADNITEFPANGSVNFTTIKIHSIEESYYSEDESTNFTAFGNVRTADGRSIDFNMDIGMSRSFSQYYQREVTQVAAMCDPLVLNFDGDVAELTDQKFYFDLDNDGTEDEISTLGSGSGFLALDQNNDGIINDGSELFGTSSGDGFADLARFDKDGNGWIDENDEVFDKLKIWVKDASGNDTLYSLKEKNVGAIYLGNANTDFTLRSGVTGNVNGAIRKTGIFLYEDGSGVGSVNHLDIAN